MQSETKSNLAKAYDADAVRRSQSTPAEWKVRERAHFQRLLVQENKKSLLEIGAGTGIDSLFFSQNGFEVTSVDLSSEMVRFCREKGLRAMVMDFYDLQFPDQSFDAVYALNCLLHVPKQEIGQVLSEIKRIMKPDGLFFMGVYGGTESEGIWENDWCEPKRLFSSFTDESIVATVGRYFEVVRFAVIPLEAGKPHFQSLTLRKITDKD